MWTKSQVEAFLGQVSSDKVDILIDTPEVYISSMKEVCDYFINHIDVQKSMTNHMIWLKQHIDEDQDLYILEELIINDIDESNVPTEEFEVQ